MRLEFYLKINEKYSKYDILTELVYFFLNNSIKY